ncbi:CUGBP Elav-like family member 5 [Tachysurus ichikawai]
MQQQAAIMAASHGGYLAPSMAFPATQIHQVGAINMNGLPPTPMTPVSAMLMPVDNYTYIVASKVLRNISVISVHSVDSLVNMKT